MVVPPDIPVTIPLEFIVPTDGLLLLHVPPVVDDDRETADSTHTVCSPVIGLGNGFTVATFVLTHPDTDSL